MVVVGGVLDYLEFLRVLPYGRGDFDECAACPVFFLASTGAALLCRKLLIAMRALGRAGISPAIYIDMYTAGVFGFLFLMFLVFYIHTTARP